MRPTKLEEEFYERWGLGAKPDGSPKVALPRDDRIVCGVEALPYRLSGPRPRGTCPSQARRTEGIRTGGRRYALVVCSYAYHRYSRRCTSMMIVKAGQKTATCPRCGKRRWLAGLPIVAVSDQPEELRRLIPLAHGHRTRRGFLPAGARASLLRPVGSERSGPLRSARIPARRMAERPGASPSRREETRQV